MVMNRSFQVLKGFSIALPIFEKSTFIDDKNIQFSRSEKKFYTRNTQEIFKCGTAE